MKKLYHFEWDCGRSGTVEGTFVAEEADIAAAMGGTVEFGEILGKHSDVRGELGQEDLTVLTDDQTFIEQFERFVPRGAGYNPLSYIYEERRKEDGA